MMKDDGRVPQAAPGCEASPSAADGVFAESHPSRVSLMPISTDVWIKLPEREQKLQSIADVIAYWLRYQTGESEAMADDDTHVWLNGYDGAPPQWPSVGVLARWLHVLRDSRSKPDRAETTKIGSVEDESGGAEGNRQEPVAPPSQPGEYQRLADEMSDAIRFIEHISEVAGYPRDELAREEFDDKLQRYRTAIRQLKDTP